MPDKVDLLETAILRPFVRCLERRGIETEHALEAQRIPPELVARGEGMIVKEQAWRFFDEIVRSEGVRTLGFLDGDRLSPEDFGGLSALCQAVTLQDAIESLRKLVALVATGNRAWLQRGSDESWLYLHTARFSREVPVADHGSVLYLREIVRLAAGPDWHPRRIAFWANPSDFLAPLPEMGETESRFRQPAAGVSFPTEMLSWPIRPVQGVATRSRRPTLPNSHSSLSERLRVLLSGLLPYERKLGSDQVAEILDITRTTLYRRLATEGTSFRMIVERVGFEEARQALLATDVTVQDLADHLGYSCSSNFIRAFERLAGCTPGEFRKREQAAD